MDIEGNLAKLIEGSSSKQQLEMIDKDITYALNKVCKKIEGPRRGIPYLKEKVWRNAVLQYQKAMLQRIRGEMVNQNKLDFRVQFIDQNVINLLIEQVQHNLEEAKQKQQELVVEGQKYREKEILNYHKSEIPDSTDANKK